MTRALRREYELWRELFTRAPAPRARVNNSRHNCTTQHFYPCAYVIASYLTVRLARRRLAPRPHARDGQNESLVVAAVKPLLLSNGFQIVVNDQPFALRRGRQVFGEEAVRQALARDLFAPSDDDLDRQKVDLGAGAEFDKEAGNGAKARRPFEERYLVRVQVVEIEEIAPGGLGVVEDRAAFGRDHSAVIRLGLRFGREQPPLRVLIRPSQSAEFRIREALLRLTRSEIYGQRQAAPRFAALDKIFSGNCFASDIGLSGALVTFIGAVDRLLKTTAGFCAATFEVHSQDCGLRIADCGFRTGKSLTDAFF